MAKLTVEEFKEYTTLPPDSIVHLKVDELTEREVQGANGTWTKLEFKFKVLGIQAVGDGGDPNDYSDLIAGPIWGSVPLRLSESPENKLRLWGEAILGIEMGVGFELDTDIFLGREVRGLTSQYEKRVTNPRTGLPVKAHQIDSLLPKAATGQSTQPTQPGGWGWEQRPGQQAGQAQPQQAPVPAQQAQPAQQPFDPWQPSAEPPPF